MSSLFHSGSPPGSRSSTPDPIHDHDYLPICSSPHDNYVPPDFDDMLYQSQTDRTCIPYHELSCQCLSPRCEVCASEVTRDLSSSSNARAGFEPTTEPRVCAFGGSSEVEALREEQFRYAEAVPPVTLSITPPSRSTASNTVLASGRYIRFEPSVAKALRPQRMCTQRRVDVESRADFSDSDDDESVNERRSTKRPMRRCGHRDCTGKAALSSKSAYVRHYHSVHLGLPGDVRCGGCGLSFLSGRRDSVLRHQKKTRGARCRGAGMIVVGSSRRVAVPHPIML
ncbi:hypothetical protein PENSPDRAFT_667711 [Peniophora sp. CONT]|nr:hypothetical protein PENSPDRAFT_667711 [Peniophora sp. CONT]